MATGQSREPAWVPGAVVALIGVFVALAATSMIGDSQTSDEAIHLAAGYAHLTRADFAINPEHPPLAKEIAALPLIFMDVRLPVEDPSWSEAHRSAFQLPLGERFLHHNDVAHTTLLAAGRAPIIALGALMCLTVFALSRRLFGWRGGLLSLGLCALDPNVLAHARLVTTDLAVSFFLVLTMLCLRRYLDRPGAARVALTGCAAGLTLASKFSAIVVLPVILIVLLFSIRGGRESVARAIVAFAGMTGVAVATLAATYGFVHLPVYLSGLAGVFTTVTGGTEAFLLGSVSDRGWWYYYPVAMALKTPVPALILFAILPFRYVKGRAGPWRDQLVLLVPLALFGAASLAAARNVGLRHVLPLYPLLFALAGQAAPIAARPWARVAAALLGIWYAGSALWIHPSYLAYFNELGGGPSRGWRLLSDSNIDWGQDLARLAAFARREGVDEIVLGYYGNQDPAWYGIRWQYLPSVGHIRPAPDRLVESRRVLVAVSAMTLQGMFMRDRDAYAWLQRRDPIARIGYSIMVYDVTDDLEAFDRMAELYARAGLPRHAAWARQRAGRP